MKRESLTKCLCVAAIWWTFLNSGMLQAWALPEPYLLSDLNAEQHVDIADLAVLSENWLHQDCQDWGHCDGADIDTSSVVDFTDFAFLAENYGSLAAVQGVDLFETTDANIYVNVPADFFFPGSEPFTGTISLSGVPLEVVGPFELGTTDSTIYRRKNTLVPSAESETKIPIEFANLSLRSVSPIEVEVDLSPTYWWVGVTLDEDIRPEEAGTLMLHRSYTQGGTCDMNVPVVPKLTFTKVSEPNQVRELTLNEMMLTGTGGIWSHIGETSAAELSVPRLNATFGISIELSCADFSLDLEPPSTDPYKPDANVSPGAYVDPNVGSLGRYAEIRNGAHVGRDAVIGPYTVIDEGAIIKQGAVIGRNTYIGRDVFVAPDSIVGSGSMINENTLIMNRSYIGPNSVIGVDCNIGSGVDIGYGSFIGDNVIIGNSVKGGSGLWIGANSLISDGLRMACGAQVDPCSTVVYDLLPCSVPLGGNYVGTGYDCSAAGGVVFDYFHISDRIAAPMLISNDGNESASELDVIKLDMADPNDEWVKKLIKDMNELIDPCEPFGPNMPIHDWPYEPNRRDCDNYAGSAESGLADMNDYDANDTTFTWYITYRKVPHLLFDEFTVTLSGCTLILTGVEYTWEEETNHCKVDVHNNGETVWMEPQGDPPYVNTDMDVDEDGDVEALDSPSPKDFQGKSLEDQWTEDGKDDKKATIMIFNSREEAESKGWKLD